MSYLHPPTGLTIDYFNQRIYWADPELSLIGSMRLDGSDPLVTISDRHGKMKKQTAALYSQYSSFTLVSSISYQIIARVLFVFLRGAKLYVLPDTPPPFLSAASLKSFCAFGCKCTRRFIWTFPLLSSESVGLSQPYRIDIFEDYIYGTGLKHDVFKIHKFGKQMVEFLNLGLERPTNIFISSRYKQQDGKTWKFFGLFLHFFFTFKKGGRAFFAATFLHFIEGNCLLGIK